MSTKEIVYTLSEIEPSVVSSVFSGGAWTEGEIHLFEHEGGWYYCFSGVAAGLPYESDDVGPYSSLYEAAEAALYQLEASEPAEALRLLSYLVADGHHDINLPDFQRRLSLPDGWTWEDLADGLTTDRIRQIHDAIHAGLR